MVGYSFAVLNIIILYDLHETFNLHELNIIHITLKCGGIVPVLQGAACMTR